MIFQYTWQKVLDRTKTQTRRIIKPGEFCSCLGTDRGEIYAVWGEKKVHHQTGAVVCAPLLILERMNRLKWAVAIGWFRDKTYAVQPGRGKVAVGRIKITAIHKERLQDISPADCIAEGATDSDAFAKLWDTVHFKPPYCWLDNPEVWVIKFELFQSA